MREMPATQSVPQGAGMWMQGVPQVGRGCGVVLFSQHKVQMWTLHLWTVLNIDFGYINRPPCNNMFSLGGVCVERAVQKESENKVPKKKG